MPTTPAGGSLTIDVLPARHGDAILLSWGPAEDRHFMLVDGGPASAYRDAVAPRVAELVGTNRLDLAVLTHIDGDHIEGLILLVRDVDLGVDIGEVWFNGSGMLTEELGAVQGEMLGALIQTRGIPWNAQSDGKAICRSEDGSFPMFPQADGLHLTVLGPDRATLRRLRNDWIKACKEARLAFGSVDEALDVLQKRSNLMPPRRYLGQEPVVDVPALARQPYAKDLALANRSSIVLLVEYGDIRVLLAGDATPGALIPAIKDLVRARGLSQLEVTAFKLPHHGSARNVTRELVGLVPADYYLFSSDGSQFRHPDDAAVALVLQHGRPGAELVFNYHNDRTSRWADDRLARKGYRFPVTYPADNEQGARIALTPEALTHHEDATGGQSPPPAPVRVAARRVEPAAKAAPLPVGTGNPINRDQDRTRPRPKITETITITVGDKGSVGAQSSNRTGESDGRLSDDPLDRLVIRLFERWLALRERVWDEDEVRAFGLLLHRLLFAESPKVWNWVQGRLDARRTSAIRIMFEFPNSPAYASRAALPWEYLTGQAGDFLAADRSVVLSRYVPPSAQTPQFKPLKTLRLLPVVADPDPYGLGEVDYEPALTAIDTLDATSGIEVLPVLLEASPTALGREIARSQPHIVHFIGHGRFDPEAGRGSLALHDPAGGTKWVTEAQLVSRLCSSGDAPRIVVLHTCEGGRPDFEDRFAGLGPALIRAGVQFVAGMQYAVPNEVAIAFTEHLYALLAERVPLDQAVHECRFALADISDDPRLLGFPVLYQSGTEPVLAPSRRNT